MGVWDFRGKEGKSQGDEKEQMLSKHMFVGQWWGTERNFKKQTFLDSSLSTISSLYYTIVNYGDSTLPITGPVSKLF